MAGWKGGSTLKPLDAVVHILAIVYGLKEITEQDVYDKTYITIARQRELMVDNDILGGDSWHRGYKVLCGLISAGGRVGGV